MASNTKSLLTSDKPGKFDDKKGQQNKDDEKIIMSDENLIFSDEKARLTVLINICRMLTRRGYLDLQKYKFTGDQSKRAETITPASIVEIPDNDIFDNSKFLPFVGKRSDNGVYVIKLDNNIKNETKSDSSELKVDKAEFDGSIVVVKLVPSVVKDITNSTILNDFFKSYPNNHKIIVFDGMSDKVYSTLHKKKHVETFDKTSLMIDLMSHICAPISCEFVTLQDISHIKNPKFSKIAENDPLIRYYNGKRGQYIRVVAPSLNNGIETHYRKVIEPKSAFK